MRQKSPAVPSGTAPEASVDHEAWLQPIPESQRTRKVSGQFWIWAAPLGARSTGCWGRWASISAWASVTPSPCSFWETSSACCSSGVLSCWVNRPGRTAMVLSRAAFGGAGNYLPAGIQALLVIGWCAVNTWIILDLVMALFGTLGWVDPTAQNYAWKIGVATAIMAAQVAIAWFGYKAIAAFENWTVPPTIIILAVMSAVAWFGMKINWSYAGPAGNILEGADRIAAMSAVMTAIGIGWGITWFTYASDYSRFVSTSVPKRKLYLASVLGQFIPVVWLGILGASLATNTGEIDPGKLIVQNFGALALPVLLMVLHGPIATNILNIYTFSVATQALDIAISRRKLNLFVGVLSFVAVIFFIFQDDFASVLDCLADWAGRMGGRWARSDAWSLLLDRKRGPSHRPASSTALDTTALPVVNPAGIASLLARRFATWLFMYGMVPQMQGPDRSAPLADGTRPGSREDCAAQRPTPCLGRGSTGSSFPDTTPVDRHQIPPSPVHPPPRRPAFRSCPPPPTCSPLARRFTVNFPAFPDAAHPITWPDGHRAAASFTFDVDAESCTIAHDPKSTRRMSLMTHQSYGPKVAVPRLLQILERQDVQATFFVPGFTAECYPDVVRRIADGGHEIAHHGYLHEPMQGIDAATEARYLDRGLDALAKAAGVRPTGYRAPWWELNWHSATLLADRGFLYDSSLLDGDAPYRFSVAEGDPLRPRGDSRRLGPGRQQYAFYPGVTGSGVIESPAKVLEMWTLEAEAHHAAGTCFVLTNHPFISGRPSKAVALEKLIDRVKSMDGMWVTTMEKIAQHTPRLGSRYSHPRAPGRA